MTVFSRFYRWCPSAVRECQVGDLDMLWRTVVFDQIEESGD